MAKSERLLWHQDNLDFEVEYGGKRRRFVGTKLKGREGNLISSLTESGNHMPVIDLDFPIQAIESKTGGHFHLYIDKEISWEQYSKLLDGLYQAGLIQEGWYKDAIKSGYSLVRNPIYYLANLKD